MINIISIAQLERLKNNEEDAILYYHSSYCYQCMKLKCSIEKSEKQIYALNVDMLNDNNKNILNPYNISVYPYMIYKDKHYKGYSECKRLLSIQYI